MSAKQRLVIIMHPSICGIPFQSGPTPRPPPRPSLPFIFPLARSLSLLDSLVSIACEDVYEGKCSGLPRAFHLRGLDTPKVGFGCKWKKGALPVPSWLRASKRYIGAFWDRAGSWSEFIKVAVYDLFRI